MVGMSLVVVVLRQQTTIQLPWKSVFLCFILIFCSYIWDLNHQIGLNKLNSSDMVASVLIPTVDCSMTLQYIKIIHCSNLWILLQTSRLTSLPSHVLYQSIMPLPHPHTLLTDPVEVCGGSRQLIKILNRLGTTSSNDSDCYDTHDHFVTHEAQVQQEKSIGD